MGGATNIGHFLDRYGPRGLDIPVAGLCDAGEEGDFRRGLERAGLGSDLNRAGFFVCVADLEDELIRALGVCVVREVVAGQGELGSFLIFSKQPAQRERLDHRGRRVTLVQSARRARRELLAKRDPRDLRAPPVQSGRKERRVKWG